MTGTLILVFGLVIPLAVWCLWEIWKDVPWLFRLFMVWVVIITFAATYFGD
jgi:hypothetical protein